MNDQELFRCAKRLANIKQAELARIISKSGGSVASYEAGRRTIPAGVWKVLLEIIVQNNEEMIAIAQQADDVETIDLESLDEEAIRNLTSEPQEPEFNAQELAEILKIT